MAWGILTRRYDNKRIRLSKLLSRFISAPAVNAKVTGDITRLLHTFEESIRTLRGLDQPVDHWDACFVQLTVSKLDYSTRSDWEKFREADDIFSMHKQLTDFLENRARTHYAAQASSSSNGSLNFINRSCVSVNTTSPKRFVPSCPLCSGECHYLSKCSKFLQMGVLQRHKLMTSYPGTC